MRQKKFFNGLIGMGLLFSFAAPVAAADWKSHLTSGDQNLANSQFTSALREYDLALEMNPNAWEVYLHKAKLYEKQGRQAEVIAAYDNAMQLNPRQERLWMERSDYFIRRNMPAQARYDIEEGLRYLPYSPGLRFTRAMYLLKYDNNLPQVLEDLEIATQVRPNWLQAQMAKANLHSQLGQWPAFEQDLGVLIQYDAKNPSWYLQRGRTRIHLASLYHAQGQPEMQLQAAEGALTDMTSVLALDPKNPIARLARGKLLLFKGGMCKEALADLKMACKSGMSDACYKKPPCELPKPVPSATPDAGATGSNAGPVPAPAKTAPAEATPPSPAPVASPVPAQTPAK